MSKHRELMEILRLKETIAETVRQGSLRWLGKWQSEVDKLHQVMEGKSVTPLKRENPDSNKMMMMMRWETNENGNGMSESESFMLWAVTESWYPSRRMS